LVQTGEQISDDDDLFGPAVAKAVEHGSIGTRHQVSALPDGIPRRDVRARAAR